MVKEFHAPMWHCLHLYSPHEKTESSTWKMRKTYPGSHHQWEAVLRQIPKPRGGASCRWWQLAILGLYLLICKMGWVMILFPSLTRDQPLQNYPSGKDAGLDAEITHNWWDTRGHTVLNQPIRLILSSLLAQRGRVISFVLQAQAW